MTINATNALDTEMTTIMTRIQANMSTLAMSVHMQKGETMRLINADALYERLKSDEELARQRVIDTPNSFPNGMLNPAAVRYQAQLTERTRLKEIVYDAQTIEPQPEQRWIPCSERLPEDLEEVNVTWVNNSPEPYYDFVKGRPFTATAVYYKEKWYWYSSTCADLLAEYGRNPNQEIDDDIEIIAWMQLPEPYAERGTDDADVNT